MLACLSALVLRIRRISARSLSLRVFSVKSTVTQLHQLVIATSVLHFGCGVSLVRGDDDRRDATSCLGGLSDVAHREPVSAPWKGNVDWRETGQGDLVIKRANVGGDANLIIDVALIHEFGGNHMADVSLNGTLRHVKPDKLFEAAARTRCVDTGRPTPRGRVSPTLFLLA